MLIFMLCTTLHLRVHSFCKQLYYAGEDLPNDIEEGHSKVVVAVAVFSLVLVQRDDDRVTHALGHCTTHASGEGEQSSCRP